MSELFPSFTEYAELNNQKSHRNYFKIQKAIRKIRKAITVYESTSLALESILEESQFDGDIKIMINVQYFSMYAVSDFLLLQLGIFKSKSEYLKKQLVRYMSIVAYEALQDFYKLRDRTYREVIAKYADEKIRNGMNDVYQRIRKLRKTHEIDLRKIRNQIGAHRNIHLFNSYFRDIGVNEITTFCAVLMTYIACANTYDAIIIDKIMKNSANNRFNLTQSIVMDFAWK